MNKSFLMSSYKFISFSKNIFHFQDKLKKVPGFKPPRCNNSVKMECAKVVDTIDVEDMGDKVFGIYIYLSNSFIIFVNRALK